MMMIRQNRFSPFLPVLFSLLIVVCFHPQGCRGDATKPFLQKPRVQWTYRLPGSGTLTGRGLRNGNEVLSSPDGTTLFVTADDGSLHIIPVNSLREAKVYEPARVPGTYTECRSGVSLVFNQQNQQQVDFILYAVIDIPIKAGVLYDGMTYDPSRTTTLSRLLAVNLDGTLRFSVPLNGAVMGNPIVGGANDKVYVVHNVPSYNNNAGLPPTRGKISVVRIRANPPTVTASLSPFMAHGPFGPPTGTTVTIKGKRIDVLVVAEAWGDGYSDTQGKVFLLRPSSLYDEFNGQGNDSYELKLLSDLGSASAAKPSVKADGTELFVGSSGAKLGGWTSKDDLWSAVSTDQTNVNPSWGVNLEQNKANASQPLLVAPLLSADESLVYQIGASTQMYCIDAQTGGIEWNSDGAAWGMRGGILAEPRLLENVQDQPKVYVIETLKGRVRQHDALTGDIDWAIDCHAVSGIPCNDAVEADFSVSPSGTTVYYGDIFGKVVALEVADFSSTPRPTALPTPFPTPLPTPRPTARPTPRPTQKQEEEEEEKEKEKEKEKEEEEEEENVEAEAAEDISMTEWMSSPAGERTPAPTVSPVVVVPVTPAPVPLPLPEPNIDSVPFQEETGAPTASEYDDDDNKIVEPDTISVVDANSGGDSSESGFSGYSSSSAIDGNEGDTDSFFSNEIMIILVAVCGGLALAIIVILIAQKARAMQNNNKKKPSDDHMLVSPEDDGKDWNNAQDEYEEECRRDEEETLREIVGSAKTPSKGKKNQKKPKKMSPKTPSTLASIEECPTENELSFVSDATPDVPTPKKLEQSFHASLAEEKSLEVTLNEARAQKDSQTPLGSKDSPSASMLRVISLASGHENNANVKLDTDAPPQLSSVEVVAKTDIAGSKQHQQPVRRAISPVPRYDLQVDSAANDLMSVDGSLYLDDDSKFDVASLAQYSVASTTDGAASAELGAHYPSDGGVRYEEASPGDQYMKPPGVASPLMGGRQLSPEVTNYLRRNQASMSPDPMTPKHIENAPTSPISTSPVTPPTVDSAYEREVVQKGQSARKGRSRSPSPPPPPVTAAEQEEDQPEDAWNSFLSELAKAEREFFNPSYNKKQKAGRAQSPPPPPPPPGDPPASKSAAPPPPPPPPSGRHRTRLV